MTLTERTEELVRISEEKTGIGRVDRLDRSFYILHDGTLLGCYFDMGTRGDDHRLIFAFTDIDRNDWTRLHDEYKVIRYIPECEMGIIKQG